MRQGIPLTDADRAPWLKALRDKIIEWRGAAKNVILACSALKEIYRRELLVGPEVKLVYLKGTYELFSQRVSGRKGHFAKQGLIASQFAALEEPAGAVTVDTTQSPDAIAEEIRRRLALN
jgi:gluconokinase